MAKGVGMFVFEDQEMLSNWLIDLDYNHQEGSITLSSVELASWFNILEIFQKYHMGKGNGLYDKPINYNLQPNAIINLINKARNSGCK